MPYSDGGYLHNAGTRAPWRIRLTEMRTERSTFDGHWYEIDRFMAPGRYRQGHSAQENRGGKKHQAIIDETALRARRVFTAGFVSGMTSPARPWFKLSLPDDELAHYHSVKRWLEEVEKRIYLILAQANFYQVIATVYDTLGTFGTAAVTVVERPQSLVWFRPHPAGDFYCSSNNDMIVDTIYRETKKKVRELVETFGYERCSTSTQSQFNSNRLDEYIDVVQAIEPNDKRIPGHPGAQGMPYRSVWFEETGPEQDYLGRKGFRDFPSMVVRWFADAMDDYAIDCPGMTALGGVKQLQHQQAKKGQAIDKIVNPHLQVPTDLQRTAKSFLPGGTTYYDATNPNAGVRPIHDLSQMRLTELGQDIRDVQERINESFFVDLFLMISQQDDVRTATEVALRNEEKLLVLGPALQRVQTELLDPVIDRVYSIMERTGNIPEPPPEISDMPLRTKYISMLAQAQQSVGASSIERFMNMTSAVASVNPNVIDKVDHDAGVEEYGEILGVPSRLIRSEDEVADIREARAAEQRQAQQLEAANQAAAAAKTASEVNISDDGPLGPLIN
ncbi:MAG: portal protein [Pseudomonadota bacterium]